jgi:hypothetical protein
MEQNELVQILDRMNDFYLEILVSEGDTMTVHEEFDLLIETLYGNGYTILSIDNEYVAGLYESHRTTVDNKLKAVASGSYELAHTLRIEELRLKECLGEIVYFTLHGDKIIEFIVAF